MSSRAFAQGADTPDNPLAASNLQLEPPTQVEGEGPQLIEAVAFDNEEAGTEAHRHLVQALLGRTYSAAGVRSVLTALADSGRYAELSASWERGTAGVRVSFHVVARKIITAVEIVGGELATDATRRVSGLAIGDEITQPGLPKAAAQVWQHYRAKGYRAARVSARWKEVDTSGRVSVVLTINAGPLSTLARRHFEVDGPDSAALEGVLQDYAVAAGDTADEEALSDADRELEKRLHTKGWFRASVAHRITETPLGVEAFVELQIGPQVTVRFERNRKLDSNELLRVAVAGDDAQSVDEVIARLKEYYAARGYYDVRIRFQELQSPDGSESDWLFTVIEGELLQVVSRRYPCLVGERTPADVDDEIDAILGEQLPGSDELLIPPAPGASDFQDSTKPLRPWPFAPLSPWTVYTPKAYQQASAHLRDLYRSEGYLSAEVGPVTLLRRACDPRSTPGHCLAMGERVTPDPQCPSPDSPIPSQETASTQLTCRQDPTEGRMCESGVVVNIPVKLGPRTTLWDVEFQGNSGIVDHELLLAAKLDLGAPVSQLMLQEARRRLLDRYQDDGYAFAEVDVDLELSPDHTRGRARFIIGERERVTVKGIVVKGAVHTNERLIRERMELVQGALYRRNWARQSEEQLAALGVFASVTVGLEDPEVPAREKMVLVQVEEQKRYYVEVRPGFSSGEGPRIEIEFGQRNLWGQAIQFRLRGQVGYVPSVLILEDKVRADFDKLSFDKRLERRNTLTFEFPIAKRYRLVLDAVDMRDNSRDYGISKEAAIATLTYRPTRVVTFWGAGAAEQNDVNVINEVSDLPFELARLLAYPDGKSFALALRGGAAWDARDSALGPTRGATATLEAEPVIAFLGADNANLRLNNCDEVDETLCEFRSRFIKITNRIAGYIPFNSHGLTLGLSLSWGANFQLQSHSITYTDRRFFMGGGESLRGHLQASLIPQDIADKLSRDDNSTDALNADQISLRAGDVIINPRAELRIPITGALQTAIFLDTGNLWRDIHEVEPLRLRYSVGTGLRYMTPVGPLALDYGIKLDRRFYETELGAFHFSLGWF